MKSKQIHLEVENGNFFILVTQNAFDVVIFQEIDGTLSDLAVSPEYASFFNHSHFDLSKATDNGKAELLPPIIFGHWGLANSLSVFQDHFGYFLFVVIENIFEADHFQRNGVMLIKFLYSELFGLTNPRAMWFSWFDIWNVFRAAEDCNLVDGFLYLLGEKVVRVRHIQFFGLHFDGHFATLSLNLELQLDYLLIKFCWVLIFEYLSKIFAFLRLLLELNLFLPNRDGLSGPLLFFGPITEK